SGSTIITSDTGAGADKEWQLVMAGLAGFDYYNIDSEVRGIMRFKGGSSAPELISTNFTSPNTDVDKLWTLIEHADGSVSFETRNLGRYLYHAEDGTMTHADTLDDRAKWILESTTTVNVGDKDSRAHSLSIYPNPSEGAFTISFESIRHAQVSISDPQGKVIYQTSSQDGRIELSKADGLSAGLYVVQVSDGTGQTVSKKLVIK
ncbi:MAG: T9SS type A sorting domain-containing protein, partial [Bacteroidota bacterium]